MKAVIMAGGEGVRLRPFTYMIPKPLLPIGNMTVIEHTIHVLKNCGFNEILISINYQSNQFEQWLEKFHQDGMKLRLIIEKKKLGTAGSLCLMKNYLTEPFCVLNGDLIIKLSLDKMLKYHREQKSELTIGIKRYDLKIPYAIVRKNDDGQLVDITEKPTYMYYINSGIYVLNPSILTEIAYEQYLDMPTLIDSMRKAGKLVSVYDIGNCWLDMGHISDYERAMDAIDQWKE